jgi:hypothetical protein
VQASPSSISARVTITDKREDNKEMISRPIPTLMLAALMACAVAVQATPTPNDDPPVPAGPKPIILDGPSFADVQSADTGGGGWGFMWDWTTNITGEWDFQLSDTNLEEKFNLFLYAEVIDLDFQQMPIPTATITVSTII